MTSLRLRLILGDQLQHDSPHWQDFDPVRDRVLMIEAAGEAEHVWSHKARIAIFLAAMRHYSQWLDTQGIAQIYVRLDDPAYADEPSLIGRLKHVLRQHKVTELVVVEPGEYRLEQALLRLAAELDLRLEVRTDSHFLCSRAEFVQWVDKKRELRMEFFYRQQRQRHRVLLDAQGQPEGGQWNFDADNRAGFPRTGPGIITPAARFEPDATTREVLQLVEQRFANHPGTLDQFAWPVNRSQALQALQRFIEDRLPSFGRYQDAMWTDTPFTWHALLSSSLNLKLLNPLEVIQAAEVAYRQGQVALPDVEGFIRQVLGWREFIRGVYWLRMPELGQANHFSHQRALPAWYWTGKTQMNCMRQCVGQTLAYGYAHHIQRLMVTGQFAVLAQIQPQQVCDWYLAVYVDAVEWVELPNTAGMALFADGARFVSKPYIASGQYIKRMSNYCQGCRYRPEQRSGENACPVTVLFWNFLDTHESTLSRNPRTVMMTKNLARLSTQERSAIRQDAERLLNNLDAL